ncbi:CDGSH iron-sulfur domain-containing protein [Actinokineospora sp. NPDC004072]
MAERPTRVRILPRGPILVDGPVEVTGADGTTVRSSRVVTALCACRRSALYPLCDTSHRRCKRT